MKLRKNQSGFSAIEVLLVLILLAIVAFAGYYVYHSQKTTKTTDTAATASQSSNKSDTKYLTVSEWGVKLPLTGDITGATYKLSNDNGLQSINITVPNSSCDSMANIVRGRGSDTNPNTGMFGDSSLTFQASDAKQVGSYYYDLAESNATSCFSGEQMGTNPAIGTKTEAVYVQLKAAFDGMSISN